MTDVNHRRTNKAPVNQRYSERDYNNGYAHPNNKDHLSVVQAKINEQIAHYDQICAPMIFPKARTGAGNIGRTDYLDKSMHGWGRRSILTGEYVGTGIGNDFHHGHKGMANAVRGAKKYVRTRIRFKENAATKKLSIKNET